MKQVALVWAAAGILSIAGCGSEPRPRAGSDAPSAGDLRPPTVRIELTTTPDVGDVPRFMAVDAMRAQGYSIDTLAFANTDLTVLALERGDLDFASVSDVSGWVAIEKGASMVAVIDDAANATVLAGRKDLSRCAALHGKRVAVPNLAGGKTFMLNRYIEKRCPGISPVFLVIAGDGARMAGLLAGEVEAAISDFAVLDKIDSARPGEFAAVVVFADEFPEVTALSHFARREFARQYPATVKHWLRAILEARRRIQDPSVLAGELVRRLEMTPDDAQKIGAAYLARNSWGVNGRFTPEIVQHNLDFAIAAGSLRPGVTAGDVADLTFLNAVLDEIGRR